MNWKLEFLIMTNREKRMEQPIKEKIRSFNRQRASLLAAVILFAGIFIFSFFPAAETLPVRAAVFCSAFLLLCGVTLLLSWREMLLLLLAAGAVTGTLFARKQIPPVLFWALALIDTGTTFSAGIVTGRIVRSLTLEKRERDRLETEAKTDKLTQLLNRNGLERAVSTAWAFCKRDQKNAGVILADIDYFKNYNDTMGHLEGDRILKQVAATIKECFKRETDIVSRIGGDEFVIFLSDVDDRHVLELAETLSASILDLKVSTSEERACGDFLSVSMGIETGVPQPEEQLIDLYKRVDEALYQAKKCGRNCISFHGEMIQLCSLAREIPGKGVSGVAALEGARKMKAGQIEEL